jgi:hypothetical protein
MLMNRSTILVIRRGAVVADKLFSYPIDVHDRRPCLRCAVVPILYRCRQLLVIAALAHNLGRWTSQIGLPHERTRTALTRHNRLFRIPGRVTRTARQWTLRMPARWPWHQDFHDALTRILALPALT